MTGDQTQIDQEASNENQQAIHNAVADRTIFTKAEAEVVEAYVGYDDRTLADVADVLDKPCGTIRSLWARARSKMDAAEATIAEFADVDEFGHENGDDSTSENT